MRVQVPQGIVQRISKVSGRRGSSQSFFRDSAGGTWYASSRKEDPVEIMASGSSADMLGGSMAEQAAWPQDKGSIPFQSSRRHGLQ